MKIGIIGTRGIPNQYGGFEQFAEFVAPALVERGHEVYVYNSSSHPYKDSSYKQVKRITCTDPESRLGTFGQFIYDFNCIIDSRKRHFDIILQLGYTSSSVWTFLYPKSSILITNMDGLEWRRTKYSKPVQQFLKRAEKWAAEYSDKLIADSKGIQQYLREKYQKDSDYIAYGATLFDAPDETSLSVLGINKYDYNLVLARMEPENNIEVILEAYQQSSTPRKLLLIGNYNNKFGSYLKDKYRDERIRFLGSVYNLEHLNNLRHFSHLYFHGHSVGGTNPSLLEAMASNTLIVAHNNVFNRAVLENDAMYFSNAKDILTLLSTISEKKDYEFMIDANRKKIREFYSWEYITNLIEKSFSDALHGNSK